MSSDKQTAFTAIAAGTPSAADPIIREIHHLRESLDRLLLLRQMEARRAQERMAELEMITSGAETARRDFLSIVSHELRTPLTSILGFLELLIGGLASTKDEEREFLTSALNSAQELRVVIDNILEMVDLDAGDVVFECEPLILPMLVQAEAKIFAPQAEAKGLRYRVEPPPPDLPLGWGDPRKFRTALRHIISNAVKYTSSGEIRIAIRTSPDGGFLVVEVSDTGPGFSPEMKCRLTEAFRQVEDPATRRHGGVGLGLAIASKLVEGMGGSLFLDSPGEGRGAHASFTIPVQDQCAPLPAEEPVGAAT